MHKAALLISLLTAAPAWALQETATESTESTEGADAAPEGGDAAPTDAETPEAKPDAAEAASENKEPTVTPEPPTVEATAAPKAPVVVAPTAPAAAPSIAPPMDPKLDGLTLGGQVIFAAALQAKSLTDAEKGRLAGAFSTSNGDWLDPVSTQPNLLKAFADSVAPLADVDPQDGSSVGGKRSELIKAVAAAKELAAASARPILRADVLSGLEVFETALKPPYAHGQSRRKIYGWTLAGFGGLVTLTGGTALINPNEPSRLGFATTATTAGILLAGAGAAMVLLDDSP